MSKEHLESAIEIIVDALKRVRDPYQHAALERMLTEDREALSQLKEGSACESH